MLNTYRGEVKMLMPCAFCGSTNLEDNCTGAAEIYGSTYQTAHIECLDCGACGPTVEFIDGVDKNGCGYKSVYDAWNNRRFTSA